jgi:hypothetical protein
LALEVVNVVEGSGIAEVMGTANFGGQLHALPVPQLGNLFWVFNKKGDSHPRAGSDLQQEALATLVKDGGLHDAPFQQQRLPILCIKLRRRWRLPERGQRRAEPHPKQ